jgi:uncharacterized delta-60 repeat protein
MLLKNSKLGACFVAALTSLTVTTLYATPFEPVTGWPVFYNGGGDERGYALAIGDDGKIYVAGSKSGTGGTDIAIWCYLFDGTLDPAFGTSGMYSLHNAAGGNGEDVALGIVPDASSGLYVTGYSRAPSSRYRDMVILKLTLAGALDTSFGTGGIVVSGLSSNDIGRAIAMDGYGNVLVAGYS